MFGGFFGVFEFLFAAPIAAGFDEGPGFGQLGLVVEKAGAVEVGISKVEPDVPLAQREWNLQSVAPRCRVPHG